MENNKLDIVEANACGIYGFLFPNNRWLIGYSSKIVMRIGKYFSGDVNVKFREAIKEHGWSSVKMYILEECENKKETLLGKEKYWSEKFDSVNNGYNVAACGIEDYGEYGKQQHAIIENKEKFSKMMSEVMKKYHATKKQKPPKKYKNWKKLWITAKQITPEISVPENLGTLPTHTEFGIEWNKLTKWNRKRVAKKII